MIQGLGGVDHVVVLVRDLDLSHDTWAALGFTLSPRGVHSAHRGTGNHTIMLGPDYVELIGVLTPTDHNAPSRTRLEKREGIERTGFRAWDAEAAADGLRRRGIAITGPQDFARPVELPGGGMGEARFRTIQWPLDRVPAGMGIFAVQHLTPEMVWLPALQRHANTARRVLSVEVLADEPAQAACRALRAGRRIKRGAVGRRAQPFRRRRTAPPSCILIGRVSGRAIRTSGSRASRRAAWRSPCKSPIWKSRRGRPAALLPMWRPA